MATHIRVRNFLRPGRRVGRKIPFNLFFFHSARKCTKFMPPQKRRESRAV